MGQYGNGYAAVRFATVAGNSYSIEGDAPGTPVAWTSLETVPGDGSVHTVTRPLNFMAALRVITPPLAPMLRVDALMPDISAAAVHATARGATGVTLSLRPHRWRHDHNRMERNRRHVCRFRQCPKTVRMERECLECRYPLLLPVARGYTGGVVWSPPGTSFRTLGTAAARVASLTITHLNPSNAAVSIGVTPAGAVESVEILAGPADAFGNVVAWPRRFTAAAGAVAGAWTANLTGLSRETNYCARALIKTAATQTVSSQRLVFRTPVTVDNLRSNLFLSEIMYSPSDPSSEEDAAGFYTADDFEYIELSIMHPTKAWTSAACGLKASTSIFRPAAGPSSHRAATQ